MYRVMKLTLVIKRAVLKLSYQGFSARQIAMEVEKVYYVKVSRQAISKFLVQYQQTRCLVRKPGSGRPSKITDAVLQAVEAKMQSDDETTATQLSFILNRCGVSISLSTIKRSRQLLGWTFHGTRYCQLIREPNKIKRLE